MPRQVNSLSSSSYARDEVNQEDSEQNEVDGMKMGADSTVKVMHM